MTILSNRNFHGWIPRAPADKLPDLNAQQALNCNFAYEELRPAKGGFPLSTLANAAKSIFTIDGVNFASWGYKARAWKGPVTGDTFQRFYFASAANGLRVSQLSYLSPSGGEPAVSYLVGVPPVLGAPTYKLVDRNTLVDYPNATVKLTSYYEDNGTRFNETPISSFTTNSPFRSYSFNVASASSSVVSPTTSLSTQQRTLAISEFSYESGSGDSPSNNTVSTGGATVTLVDATSLLYNGVTYTRVTSITPVNGSPTSPGTFLNTVTTQAGAATPSTASLSVRIDVVDSVKGTTIFSLSASSTAQSDLSNAVPGGVQATLVNNTGNANGLWRLDLTYGIAETRAYVATIVNDWNEESKPSPPVIVSPTYMQSVQLTFAPQTLMGFVPFRRCRVYRSVSSGDYLSITTSPIFFTQGATSVTVQDDLTQVVNTDATLGTTGWDMPPANLQGLTLMANGYFAAFSGDTMYFSEPYSPWAWPYVMTFPLPIKGIVATENSLVVTTTSHPYLVTGVHPSSVTQAVLPLPQAGVSEWGMCAAGGNVFYVSTEGLAMVQGYNVSLEFSQKFWTRYDWQQQFGGVLGTLELAYYDGAIVCSCPTAGYMFEIRLDTEGGGNLTMYDSSMRADALYVVPQTNGIYYVNGTQLLQYKGGSDMSYTWWGKDFILPKPKNFGAGYINTNGPVTLTIYAGDQQWFQQSFTGAGYFRIPSGHKALRWSMKLAGSGYVKEISIAETMQELANV